MALGGVRLPRSSQFGVHTKAKFFLDREVLKWRTERLKNRPTGAKSVANGERLRDARFSIQCPNDQEANTDIMYNT